jgi:hypothetical protein
MKHRRSVGHIAALAFTLVAAACSARKDIPSANQASGQLVLLTRVGCANVETMRGRVGDALRDMQLPAEFDIVDLDTLPPSDVRRGYPTPTLLYAGRDVFGLSVPKPPLPAPT